MRYLLCILFPVVLNGQAFSGRTLFPNNSLVDSVNVVLEAEEIPSSYTAYYQQYSGLDKTGTSVTLYDDSNVGPFNIGFDFKFFGVTYTQFRICTNGFITFGSTSGRYTPGSFPSNAAPNGVVAPYWTDLYPSGGYFVRYRTEGAAPNRRLVVTWHVTYYSAKSTWVDIQCVLFEGTNKIHLTIMSQGKVQTATQGVENPSGTAAFTPPGRNLSAFSGDSTTYELVPNQAIVGWQRIDSTYTVNGEYDLNGIGSNYNYRLRVEPPLYELDTSEYVNLLYHIMHPNDVRGLELTSMDLDGSGQITSTDYYAIRQRQEFNGAAFTVDEYSNMINSTTSFQANTSRTFEDVEDFIILYPAIVTKNLTINNIR